MTPEDTVLVAKLRAAAYQTSVMEKVDLMDIAADVIAARCDEIKAISDTAVAALLERDAAEEKLFLAQQFLKDKQLGQSDRDPSCFWAQIRKIVS